VPKEKESFQSLINDYSRQVLNTAIRILGDREKALDVHQEVFLAIWRLWHKYDGRTNWNAYLYQATVRKALAFAKRPQTSAFAEHQRLYPANKERPDEPLRTAELQKRLTACLTRLSKRQAEVFVMSRMEGLKTEKIAEILDCSQETVRVHLHRAVKRLAVELGDYLK